MTAKIDPPGNGQLFYILIVKINLPGIIVPVTVQIAAKRRLSRARSSLYQINLTSL